HLLVHEPPQSTSVSSPFLTASLQLAARQARLAQRPLWQSLPSAHIWPVAQGGHNPAQSTSVSPLSLIPFMQAAGGRFIAMSGPAVVSGFKSTQAGTASRLARKRQMGRGRGIISS